LDQEHLCEAKLPVNSTITYHAMDHRTEQSQGTETAFLLDETKDVHQEQTPNGYSIHNTTLKLG